MFGKEKKQRKLGVVTKRSPEEPTSSREPRPKRIRKGATKNAGAGPDNEDDGDDDADVDCANYRLVLMGTFRMRTTLTGAFSTKQGSSVLFCGRFVFLTRVRGGSYERRVS